MRAAILALLLAGAPESAPQAVELLTKAAAAYGDGSAHVAAFNAGAWIGAHVPTSPAYREIRVLKDRILELLAEAARSTAQEPAPAPRIGVAGATFGRKPVPSLTGQSLDWPGR